MRQLLYFFFFAGCCFAALESSAQKPWPVWRTPIPQPQPHRSSLPAVPPVRLLAYGASLYDGTQFKPVDSAVYTYHAGNIWDTIHNTWAFSSVQQYDDPGGLNNLKPTIKTVRYYNSRGLVDSILRIETLRTGDAALDKISYTYNNDNRIVRIEWGERGRILTYWTLEAYSYKYDSIGRLIEVVTDHPGLPWKSVRKQMYIYNSNGELTGEYGFRIIDSGSSTMTFIPTDTVHHIYNSGQRTESFSKVWRDTAWVGYQHKIYQYHNSKIAKEYWLHWNYKRTNNWDTTKEAAYTYDANGNNDTLIIKDRYTIGEWQRFIRTYNAYGLILTSVWDYWDNATSTWKFYDKHSTQERFYYGLFNLSISDHKDKNTTVSLYPVPATNKLTIDIGTEERQLYISICTLDGRLVRTWNQPLFNDEYKETIDVSAIPAGNYMLRVQSASGQTAKQFSIVK